MVASSGTSIVIVEIVSFESLMIMTVTLSIGKMVNNKDKYVYCN